MLLYFLHLATALSQFFNVLIGGHPDETISARAHRRRLEGHAGWARLRNLLNRVFFWQADHCASSFAGDCERAAQVSRWARRFGGCHE